MAAPSNHNGVPQDTLITIKVSVNDSLKKLKLPLRDLGATVLPDKLRQVLGIKPEQTVIFERFSDSAGGFITLDPNNPQVFKTLMRAAKAKLKLRLKATVTPVEQPDEKETTHEVAEAPAPQPKTMEPVIVRSPVPQAAQRDSTAFDRRSVGSGIFQFREARASQQTLVNTDEAPVPQPFTTDNKDFFDGLARHPCPAIRSMEPTSLPIRKLETANGQPWSVYCNECDKPMADAHFHCSICDGGDYDLCEACVASGKLCPGEGHWLIKRFIKDGKVINSTTERISPRVRKLMRLENMLQHQESHDSVEVKKEMPGSFAEDTKTLAEEPRVPTRTCNSCVVVLPEREFITCTDCEDFDLCISCHTSNKHGHHPAHNFKPATDETVLPPHAEAMLSAGRNIRHKAICDGCDKPIYGVRHKCLNCPDWDYCNECVKDARNTHPRHRFAALYQPIPDPMPVPVRHVGIFCDGPLCSGKAGQSCITGVRFKCAVCHDTNYCASCEAFPGNHHNRTHPLIKFKTPVRSVSITTENADQRGNVRMMGDRVAEPAQKSAGTETTPVTPTNVATPVQTMAEIEPTEVKQEPQPIPVIKSEEPKTVPTEAVVPTLLNAHFVNDSIVDGTVVLPGTTFTQIWTLKNVGPYAWPAGCSVRYTGGDNMLNVDNSHPASVTDIAEASESNVVGREVQVGEEVAFKVALKAPTRPGKAISYWRLKAADGTPFGHRLWCDIEVKTPELPNPVLPALPAVQPTATLAHRQAQFAQMQAMRQQQEAMMRARQAQMQQQQNALLAAKMGAPPAYTETNETLHARLAAMRAEQQKRRESMIAQMNARRDAMQAAPTVPAPSEDDKARKEAAKQRVEHIKAKIMRTREERNKMLESQGQKKPTFSVSVTTSAEQKSAEETEKVKKIIEEVSKNVEAEEAYHAASEAEAEKVPEGRVMVFPKLEKESPASSTYQSATSSSTSKGKAAYVENEEGEIETSAEPAAAPATPAIAPVAISEPSVASPLEDDFEDIVDEIEVLSAAGDMSEDDGFLTDEEYDILDASDNETAA